MDKGIVAVVVGTRPEVIKMAPVYLALRQASGIRPLLVSTGQHREMLQQALASFGLAPDVDLALMRANQGLGEVTARVLLAVGEVIRAHRPDALLVQGDTTSAFAAALAASYERTPVGHVEAGLRTYNENSPWPEENNRRLIGPIARWCFAPTEWSAENLRKERIPRDRIYVTGNTVIDALMRVLSSKRCEGPGAVAERCGIPRGFLEDFISPSVSGLNACGARRWILVTGHRRESFGSGFEGICRAIAEISERFPDVGVLYPVHLNPCVREPVHRMLGGNSSICLIEPVSYGDFLWLMSKCYFVMSDSGGIQEEAPSLGKPVLVLRETTERPEGVQAGTCRLVGTDAGNIVREAALLLGDHVEYGCRAALKNPYGDGRSSLIIAKIMEEYIKGKYEL